MGGMERKAASETWGESPRFSRVLIRREEETVAHFSGPSSNAQPQGHWLSLGSPSCSGTLGVMTVTS